MHRCNLCNRLQFQNHTFFYDQVNFIQPNLLTLKIDFHPFLLLNDMAPFFQHNNHRVLIDVLVKSGTQLIKYDISRLNNLVGKVFFNDFNHKESFRDFCLIRAIRVQRSRVLSLGLP